MTRFLCCKILADRRVIQNLESLFCRAFDFFAKCATVSLSDCTSFEREWKLLVERLVVGNQNSCNFVKFGRLSIWSIVSLRK